MNNTNAIRYYVVSADYKIISRHLCPDEAQDFADTTNRALAEYGFEPSNWIFAGSASEAIGLGMTAV